MWRLDVLVRGVDEASGTADLDYVGGREGSTDGQEESGSNGREAHLDLNLNVRGFEGADRSSG